MRSLWSPRCDRSLRWFKKLNHKGREGSQRRAVPLSRASARDPNSSETLTNISIPKLVGIPRCARDLEPHKPNTAPALLPVVKIVRIEMRSRGRLRSTSVRFPCLEIQREVPNSSETLTNINIPRLVGIPRSARDLK